MSASTDQVMAELQSRVRERVRAELVRHGASAALEDPALFADIDTILRAAIERSQPAALLLPELLGDPSTWRLDTAIKYQTHRGAAGAPIVFVKQRLLMPLLRWFYEFNRDNFERQRRINQVLFACVQELAIELAKQKRELQAGSTQSVLRRP
ncbi:MAG TPA: hypothetical protein VFU28_15465 [Vicinamibacterales bacterium]|nr:hypothetical protein [Vicinamibacterales bacterium]